MTIVILVHGFNVWDGGRATIGKLRPFFADRGVPYIMVSYGHFFINETYRKNKKVAKKIAAACANAKASGHKVIVVGHSNGCAIAHQAAHDYDAPIDKVVYINPALDSDAEIAATVGSLDVWYSPSDKPVKFAKWLPWHPWGAMGATGYTGDSKAVRNINKEARYDLSSNEHSDLFGVELLPFFGSLLVDETLSGREGFPSLLA